jgi:[protein-PII] uridylyltransferase
VDPRVLIDNKASANHTVIEVNGRDRPGLLCHLTAALVEHRLQIAIAKVSTYGEEVVDVFYVKDTFGMKVEHPVKVRQIQDALKDALQNSSDTTAPPPTALAQRSLKRKGISKGKQKELI